MIGTCRAIIIERKSYNYGTGWEGGGPRAGRCGEGRGDVKIEAIIGKADIN